MSFKNTTSFALSALALILVAVSFTLVLNKNFRNSFNHFFTSDQRLILAKLETSLSLPNKSFKVLKISSKKNLWVEIYDVNFSEDRIAEFKLPVRTDGRMFINNRTSSLFASDLDGDQILEIIVPTFDLELNPQIYAYRYNPITNSFSEISDQDLLQKLKF